MHAAVGNQDLLPFLQAPRLHPSPATLGWKKKDEKGTARASKKLFFLFIFAPKPPAPLLCLRSLTPEAAAAQGIGYAATPAAAAAQADVVSLHVAANAGTKGLANREFFEAMRPGAMFINTTRGSVVDEEALVWALDTKGIRAGVGVGAVQSKGCPALGTCPLGEGEAR